MRISIYGLGLTMGLLALAGCGQGKTPATPVASAPTVHEAMANTVVPKSTALWETAAKATNDAGDPDGSKMTDAQWTQIAADAQAISDVANKLGNAETIKVLADPSLKIQDEGPQGASGAQVQAFIDKDPAAFKAFAKALAANSDAFVAAAHAKDAVKLGAASDALDGVCEACHMKFWYPPKPGAPPAT